MKSNTKSSITLPAEGSSSSWHCRRSSRPRPRSRSCAEACGSSIGDGARPAARGLPQRVARDSRLHGFRARGARLARGGRPRRAVKIRRGAPTLPISARASAPAREGPARLVIQTDLLNEAEHPSTWVLPCTTRTSGESLLRVPLPRGVAGNRQDCEVMSTRPRDRQPPLRARTATVAAEFLREVEEKLRLLADL